jgi:hypothetical protein
MGSLKKKDFKHAGVPDCKSPVVTPLEHLNAILEGCFEASMLMTPFSVQVLFPKQNNYQIDKMMITLKEHSEWISNNKKNSAEKPLSIQLSEELKKSCSSPNLSKGTVPHQGFIQTLSTRVTVMKMSFKK